MGEILDSKRRVAYYLQNNGTFVIDNYDLAKPFASFLPGIAGIFGIPMWVFYVNRGQAIASFGTENKDNAILEFFPANRAWQNVSFRGFRTFLKIEDDEKIVCYEPFQNNIMAGNFEFTRKMLIRSNDFSIQENNQSLDLNIDVDYFTLENEPLSCLARRVVIKNVSKTRKKISVLDGLPQIAPYGVSNWILKELSRTIEAWMQVKYVTKENIPFYKLAVEPADCAKVVKIKGGNFYYNYFIKDSCISKSSFIIDPLEIFGSVLDFNYPERFFVDNFAVSKKQVQCGKTPCGFGSSEFLIEAGEQVQIFSFIGHTEQENYLNAFVHKITDKSYVEQKLTDCRQSIDKLENNISTFSQDSAYNFYCKQTYLDNLLRGGFPLNLKSDKEKSNMLYVFSRKHGDLERDYNNFLLEANYFSQGDGNYRDVNQNRRNDVWFNPLVEDANVLKFFNLLQLDGFNPLVVKSGRFKLNLKKEKILFESKHIVKGKDSFNLVIDFINDYFTPGGLFMFLENKNIALNVSLEEFLQIILSCCKKYEMSEHKEGFWIDHWTYNLDILESYLSIYPERLENIFLDKKEFVFYHNSAYVLPRDEKYVLENGKVRQFNAVAYAKSDIGAGNLVKTKYGKGNVYQTNLCVKILCLIANKMASFDAFGCGIEMEADKPGWYDSLNGLPGLLGSSVCESLELKRMIVFLLKVLQSLNLNPDAKISVFKELFDFLNGLSNLIFEYFNIRNVNKDFIFWDKACSLKESYRKKIRCGINGAEREFSFADLKNILSKMNNKIALSMGGMRDKNTGLFYTYFINEVIDYRKLKAIDGKNFKTNNQGLFYVRPKKFKQIHLPLFLEAQVHALRIEKERQKVKQIYKNVRKSSLYDQQLKMYKVNACLKEMPADIGRTRVFTPGWLENESVWLHMEYKYLLELLRTGLYAEFFIEFKNVLIPFQNPQQYGRSILENSSFLVSSVYPDKSLRGSGFVARLSGSTAEFVNMWLWMNVGANPFKVDSMGELCLEFKPVLPAWMFTLTKKDCVLYNAKGLEITFNLTKNSYAFNFLSSTLVVFHNPKRKNTFGKDCAKLCRIELIYRNQRKIKLKGNVIPAPYALGVRQGKFERINIALG